MKKIAYYITAHGYGHGTRSCDILTALRTAAPAIPIVVKTDLPVDFMASRLPESIEVRPGAFDVGLIQKDSIQVDLAASLATLDTLYARWPALVEQERRFIEQEAVGVVVADVPAIPLAAAQQAGVPDIATSNFGWDWIYDEFAATDPRWQRHVDAFRSVYAQTRLLLRQPFSEPMAAFRSRIDLPLLAKPGTGRRAMLAEKTGTDPAKKWILLSFTSLDLDTSALANLAKLKGCELFSVEPLGWPGSCVHTVSRSFACFADILASVDVVVTKPGFGIVSECIANNKPILYSDRKHFREYAVLVESIRRHCRQAFIPNAELYAGDLARALEEVDTATHTPEPMPRGGAELAARIILGQLAAL